jgi:Mn-dependent DtxR family transcriptional regulator
MEKALKELDPGTLSFKVLVYLTFKDHPMKPIDISRGLGENSSSVRARLAELKQAGLVENTSEGYVASTTSYDVLMKLFKG